MKLSSFLVFRPISYFIILSFIVLLLLPTLLVPLWINKIHGIETEVNLSSNKVHQGILSGIQNTAKLFSPTNLSLAYLQRFLNSSLKADLPFSAIKSQVAPTLYLAFSTIPHLSQISYIALDGLFFSYYIRDDQTFAVYSNVSFSFLSNATADNYTWYNQTVDRATGEPYGEAIRSPPLLNLNLSWFQEVLKSRNGYSSVGTGWSTDQDPLLLRSFGIDQSIALSLGFPVKTFTDSFSNNINAYGGELYLATDNGTVLTRGIPNTRIVKAGNSVSVQTSKPNVDEIGNVGDFTCQSNDSNLTASVLEIWKTKYLFYCSPLEIAGVKLVYVLAIPCGGLEGFLHQNIKFALELLVLMVVAMAISIFTFIFSSIRSARKEMYLCAALIKQLEATQQAERKSMNKSLAFARASHDVRASLAAIIGSIRLIKVARGSDLQENLIQAETNAEDLLGMLNSILDTSKIEAGKSQLEEEEFDLQELLEDVVDLYHTIGLKKDVDVILDPCDGSVMKCSRVKGDRGKLKQILWNLLSNAVKFTSEGHVSVRVWAKKPSFESKLLASNHENSVGCMSCLFYQTDCSTEGSEVANRVQEDPSCTEFILEVSDTGRGIPKEKRKMVFENYVQVKEIALGQEGTGLGLGIVQSLVRIMGGEIAIVEKEQGEKGTCFRFNTFFTLCSNQVHDHDTEFHASRYLVNFFHQQELSTTNHSPKGEGSCVLLFLSSGERSKITKKFMESLGIDVSIVKQYEQLSQSLKEVKQMLISSCRNPYQKSDSKSRNDRLSRVLSNNSYSRSKDMPLSAFDGLDSLSTSENHIVSNKKITNFVLIVIDINAGPFHEISRAVAEFRRGLTSSSCNRIVWIDKQGLIEEEKLPATDLIISRPFHGSRLYQVLGLLPEFGGMVLLKSRHHPSHHNKEIQEIGSSKAEKPLQGKKVLVVEDNIVLQKVAILLVSQLGAVTQSCKNGEEALEIVCKSFRDLRKNGSAHQSLPFDYILMDCEMQGMDGYEATRCIREEEKIYNVHTPIIALTAHTQDEVKTKIIEAGMDYYLSKPLTKNQLLDAIVHMQERNGF